MIQISATTKGEFLVCHPNPGLEQRESFISDSHYLEYIPKPPGWKRNAYSLKCIVCKKENRKHVSQFRCKHCPSLPTLCPVPCFEVWHKTMLNELDEND